MADPQRRLVILGSTTTALAVARNAFALGLDSVILDTTPGIAGTSRRARSVVLTSDDPGQLLAEVVRHGQDGESFLIATGDEWVRFIRTHRTALAVTFRDILHPANDVLDICLNKLAFAEWCAGRGIPSPTACLGSDEARLRRLRLPLFLRPMETAHSGPRANVPKAVQIESDADLARWLRRFAEQGEPVVVSESLLGRPLIQYSVPFARRGGRRAAYVARKLRPLPESCRVGTYVETAPDPAVEALAMAVVEGLDFEGVGEVEILRATDTGALWVIEVNARPWSQYSMAARAGFDYLALMLGYPLVAGDLAAPRQPVRWIDFTSDLYNIFSRSEGMLAAGKIGFGGYLRSLAAVNAFAKFDPRDPRPFFTDLVGFLRGRLA